MTRPHRQEGLARAYVQAIAARCGMGYSVREQDYGVDITLQSIVIRGQRRVEAGYALDIQAKSTTQASVESTHISYDMEVKTYQDLSDPAVGCPRILVLLVLPDDETQWTSQSEEELSLRRCAYWLSLKGGPPTSNRKTVRIAVPWANVFSVAALHDIMDRVKGKVDL